MSPWPLDPLPSELGHGAKWRLFQCYFNGFCLKNKVGVTGNFVHMKNSYKRREQLSKPHGPIVQGVDNAIQQINHYPVDSVVCFVSTYPLDSDLSGD